jgi:SNF2 family DNA or RNA helicase
MWVPMGRGKSRIIVDYVQNQAQGPALILAPLKVCPVWMVEFKKYCEETWQVRVLDRSLIADRAEHLKVFMQHQKRIDYANTVVVLNYDACFRTPLSDELMKIPWDIVVLDECHRVKAPMGVTSKFVAKLAQKARKVIGLSGTPLSTGQRGRGGKKIGAWLDIYGQARAISPGTYGYKVTAFKAKYGIWMSEPFPKLLDDQNMEDFNRRLASFVFHVPEDELTLILPEVTEQVISVHLPPDVYKAYQFLEDEMVTQFEDEVYTASNALVKMLRLQQIAGGFIKQSDIREWVGDRMKVTQKGETKAIHTEKIDAIAEIIEDMDPEEKVTIFCKFRAEIADLTERLDSKSRKVFHVMGGVNTIDPWKKSTGGILLLQIQAGSEGIDCTDSRYCFYCSLCHSWKDYQQSRKRVHRPGQLRPVTYYHIVAENTIDIEIYKALDTKTDAVNILRDALLQRRSGTNQDRTIQ